MLKYWNKVPARHCSKCGTPIGEVHVNLHRNEERFMRPGPPSNLEVQNARVLKSYCMKCGMQAASTDLENQGFVCHVVEDYENTRLCTSCGKNRLRMNKWRPVYLVAINEFKPGGESLGTIDEKVVVIACAQCETSYGRLRPVPLALRLR